MRERTPGPGPGEVNNAPPRKNQFFLLPPAYGTNFFISLFIPYQPPIPYAYHLHTICVPYKPPIPYAYHLHTICAPYKPFIPYMDGTNFFIFFLLPPAYGTKFFLIFFHHLRMVQFIRTIYAPSVYHLCTIQSICTICLPYMYGTNFFIFFCCHPRMVQFFFEILSSLVKK